MRDDENIRVLENQLLKLVSRSIELIKNLAVIFNPLDVGDDSVCHCVIVVFQAVLEVFDQLVEGTAFGVLLISQLFDIIVLPEIWE